MILTYNLIYYFLLFTDKITIQYIKYLIDQGTPSHWCISLIKYNIDWHCSAHWFAILTQYYVCMPHYSLWIHASVLIWHSSHEHKAHLISRSRALQIQPEAKTDAKKADRHTGFGTELLGRVQRDERGNGWKEQEQMMMMIKGMVRQASQTGSVLPIPECRFILNAVNTAGPSLKNRQTQVRS